MHDRFLRLPEIIGDPKRGIPRIVPLSRTTWLAGVKDGRFPQPVRLAKRAVAWRESEIYAFVETFK